jgi:nitrous oxidase accessory protein NosD
MTSKFTIRIAALLGCLLAATAQARTLEVGAGKEYKLPSAAIAAAQDGDLVAIQPGEYFDCAIVRPNHVVIEGVGDAAKVVLTDKTCGGKAILVTTGGDITVRNLTLTRARVPDRNGGGIRAEGRNLLVDKVRFVNNETGILTTPDVGTLTVRDSLFDSNGSCEASCAHGIYAGDIDLLRVERSHFLNTHHAHHIKSRARRTEVIGCTIEDGPEGTASYEIEVANGGAAVIRDNTIEKGPKAENHTGAIMIGTDGITQPTPEIVVENNRFRNDGDFQTIFVDNLSATPAVLRGNQFTGAVTPLKGDGQVVASK